jgi:hypothetical protein
MAITHTEEEIMAGVANGSTERKPGTQTPRKEPKDTK